MIGAPTLPVVSVIVATFNWSAALACALETIQRQRFAGFECLVIGDGCTDDSASVVASFADPRFSWQNLEINHGSQWAANNAGLVAARGEWIAYCGHDDIWHPDHLESMLATARASGARALSATMLMYGPRTSGIIQVAGTPVGDSLAPSDFIPPSGFMHRRDLVERVGQWSDAETLSGPVDVEFQERIAALTPIVPSRRLTVFKFNAAYRRNSYKVKSITEQQAFLDLIRSGNEFRHAELERVLTARARDLLVTCTKADTSSLQPGAMAKAARRFKGVDRRYEVLEKLSVVERAIFDASFFNGAYEWYELEGEGDRTFKWSGPSARVEVDLPLEIDHPAEIKIFIVSSITPETIDELRLTICSKPVTFEALRFSAEVTILELRVDPSLGEHVSIAFEINRTLRPCDLANSGSDTRWLGFALNRIELKTTE